MVGIHSLVRLALLMFPMSSHERLNSVSRGLVGSDRRNSFCAAILPPWFIAHTPLIAAPRGVVLLLFPSMTKHDPSHPNSVPQMGHKRAANSMRYWYQPHSCQTTDEGERAYTNNSKTNSLNSVHSLTRTVIDSTALQRLSPSL